MHKSKRGTALEMSFLIISESAIGYFIIYIVRQTNLDQQTNNLKLRTEWVAVKNRSQIAHHPTKLDLLEVY